MVTDPATRGPVQSTAAIFADQGAVGSTVPQAVLYHAVVHDLGVPLTSWAARMTGLILALCTLGCWLLWLTPLRPGQPSAAAPRIRPADAAASRSTRRRAAQPFHIEPSSDMMERPRRSSTTETGRETPMVNRRTFLARLAVAITAMAAGVTVLPDEGEAGPVRRERKRRRRVRRRRRRRRHRRRVVRRAWRGHHRWVVPVALAVGWELAHEDRIVVVHEVKYVEVEGEKTEVVVTTEGEEIYVVREDDKTNASAEEGSFLPDDDASTPGVDVEVEEEVEE